MRIELIELSENNLQQCFDLNVESDQKQYIASNEESWKTAKDKEEGQRLICSRIRTGPEATAKSGGFVLTELCGFIPVNKRSR